MDFIDYSGQGYQDVGEEPQHPQHPRHFGQPSTSAIQDQPKPAFFSSTHVPHPMSCEIKPRLTKEQHDILESHYQKQNKPNTNTKKGFAESLGVSLDKVNVSIYGYVRPEVIAETLQ